MSEVRLQRFNPDYELEEAGPVSADDAVRTLEQAERTFVLPKPNGAYLEIGVEGPNRYSIRFRTPELLGRWFFGLLRQTYAFGTEGTKSEAAHLIRRFFESTDEELKNVLEGIPRRQGNGA